MAGWILLIRAISQIAETKELMIQFYMSKNSLRTQTEGDVPKLTRLARGRKGKGGEERGDEGVGEGEGGRDHGCNVVTTLSKYFSLSVNRNHLCTSETAER